MEQKNYELYTTDDFVDEGFFSTEITDEEKDKPLKRGRGSQKKTKVLVMAESKAIEGETTKNGNAGNN